MEDKIDSKIKYDCHAELPLPATLHRVEESTPLCRVRRDVYD